MSEERVIVVSGAGGALGGAVARELVRRGYAAVLLDAEVARERLGELGAELGARAVAHAGDLSTRAAWDAAMAAARRAFRAAPRFGVLAAGAWAGGAGLHEATEDGTYARMMSMNVDTAYRGPRALLPEMVAAGAGSVVVIGSRAAEQPWTSAGAAAYAASKAAVVAMAQAAAAEVRARGVRVNALLPSTLDTPANRSAMPDADHASWVSLGSAAGIIAFLLSDEAADVSGAALPLYGRA